MPMMTPEVLRQIVAARLVQTFRQYPRAGLFLSSSCRNNLIEAVRNNCLWPEELKAKLNRAAENDKWSLQAKLAWMDIFEYYAENYSPSADTHNKALLSAISEGILSAGNIGPGDNVPIKTLPESKAAE